MSRSEDRPDAPDPAPDPAPNPGKEGGVADQGVPSDPDNPTG